MKVVKKEKLVEHPLETEFDLEKGTTLVDYAEVVPSEVLPMADYDGKDNEIEQKLEDIYSVAMGQVEIIGDEIERVEGKYKARVGEVTATMLNVALGAVREKRMMKEHKDKIAVKVKEAGTPQTLNQNLIIADRNEILRTLMGNKTDK